MYGFSTRVQGEIAKIEQQVVEALKEEGFGILTEIDVQATLKNKLGVEKRPYRILGACNSAFANQALDVEPDIGLLLPCNVIVREEEDGAVMVVFMDPEAVLGLVQGKDLTALAKEVKSRLLRVRQALGGMQEG